VSTATQALAAVRSRLEAAGSGITIPLHWQNEQVVLPDELAPFAYIVFENRGAGRGPVSFGGGSGNNLYRNQALIEAFVFAPSGSGSQLAMDYAETIAARLRSFRDADISCFSASVHLVGPGASVAPPGMDSEVGNYWCAVAEVIMHFDQLG